MSVILDTERDLLGVALIDPRVTDSIRLNRDQFADGRHGAIWDAIANLHQNGEQPDPVLIVRDATGARVDHAMIVDLVGRGVTVNAEDYAEQIREHHRGRLLDEAIFRAQQMRREGSSTEDAGAILAKAIDAPAETERLIEATLTLDEFCDIELPPEQWIVPGLLARGDRIIVTGSEGLGKTQLIRQMAVCAAAGVNPFNFTHFEPRRVLYVDCENPQRIMQKRLREMRSFVEYRHRPTADRLWINRQPQGMDLAQVSDRLHLRQMCRTFNPDLLVIGPAYKLYVGGNNDREETIARQVIRTLDGLREEFEFGIILEHHSPHAASGTRRTTRPIGSSLWLRWPEFGIGIAMADGGTPQHRVVDVEHWRGGRDDRPWPDQLQSGGVVPWVDTNPEATAGKAS